jgi:crotonobetainyl-CoA:carnitine CoA-transferase CaiB-like acyl-CoA transferase
MGHEETNHMRLPARRRDRHRSDTVPMLGEHTAEVLRELRGMSLEALAALRDQGVIGSSTRP